jgi:hypothetical protein
MALVMKPILYFHLMQAGNLKLILKRGLSQAFKKAHANAGARRDIYLEPPKLECFDVAL